MRFYRNKFIKLYILIFFVSACDTVAKFENTTKSNGKSSFQEPDINGVSYAGIASIDQVTDSTLRVNWPTHAEAVAYDIFDLTSGSSEYITTIMGQGSSSYIISGLSPGQTYKYRVRIKTSDGRNDANTNDINVTTNLAPNSPSSLVKISPAQSSGLPDPIIQVSGVKSGDTIKLYTESSCTTEVASGIASGASINLTATGLSEGLITFYAAAINSSLNSSSCSTTSVSYTKLLCPIDKGEYIYIVANSDVGTTENFCVAKYEMRNVATVATSEEAGTPWVNLSASDAQIACQNLGSGYDLISNSEWMTIARDIELESSNWVGGVLNRGWSANYEDAFTNSSLANSSTLSCLYNTGANTCGSTGSHTYKRTHELSSGEEIWDFSGNAWEWVDWSIETPTNSYTNGPISCSSGANEIQDKITSCAPMLGNPLPSRSSLVSPFDTSLDSSSNIGRITGGSSGGVLRGGCYSEGRNSGIYSLHLFFDPTWNGGDRGFRCVFRP